MTTIFMLFPSVAAVFRGCWNFPVSRTGQAAHS
jgi:hypothetical protein